jgi:hypothetical protein
MHEPNTTIQDQPFLQKKISRRTFLSGAAMFIMAGSTTSCILSCGPQPAITVDFVYSTEKNDWLTKAINIFNAMQQTWQNKIIQVNPLNSIVDGWEYGSLDAAERIVSGVLKPTAWSPANVMEINYLKSKWKAKMQDPNADIIDESGEFSPQLLVFSPLVFAIWKDRSKVLQSHYGKDNINWDTLQDAFSRKNGWVELGGDPGWGPVKFGHTRPDKSNSGLLTIILLAYHVMNIQRGLTKAMIDSSKFLKVLDIFESAVTYFGRSSGTFLNNFVIPEGPASFDVITTYENLVLAQDQLFDIFYPQQNMLSEHPFALIRAVNAKVSDPKAPNWVSSEQHDAAKVFRDFLLNKNSQTSSQDIQALARSYGFRPSVPLSAPPSTTPLANPFASTTLNIKPPASFGSSEAPLDADVLDELITQWVSRYNKKPTATG